MPDIYYLKVGEYDLTVTVTHENVRLSFSKSSDKGISEFMYFVIPIEQDKAEFPFAGGDICGES